MRAVLLTLFLTGAAFGQSTILWDESVNGPFSFNPNNPTTLGSLALGTSSVIGASEVEPTGPGYFVHEDYFTFSVASDRAISSISININKPNVGAWIGDQTYSTQLSHAASALSGELLTQWSLTSIGPGLYGIYMANHDFQPFTSTANYRLDFVVIPEPSSVWLLLGGLGWLGIRGWKSTWRKT